MAQSVSRNSWRHSRFASVSRSVAWSDFFKPQTQSFHTPPYGEPTHRHASFGRHPVLQLGNRYTGMHTNQFDDPCSRLCRHLALASGPVPDSLHSSRLRSLAENLLQIPEAYAKQLSQLAETAMTLRVRLEYLSTQIILIDSRHPVFAARASPPYVLHYIDYCFRVSKIFSNMRSAAGSVSRFSARWSVFRTILPSPEVTESRSAV